jgi:hypothetical protein
MLGEMNEMWVKGISSWQNSHTNLEEIRTHINGILAVLDNVDEIERVTPQTFKYKTLVMYKGKIMNIQFNVPKANYTNVMNVYKKITTVHFGINDTIVQSLFK